MKRSTSRAIAFVKDAVDTWIGAIPSGRDRLVALVLLRDFIQRHIDRLAELSKQSQGEGQDSGTPRGGAGAVAETEVA